MNKIIVRVNDIVMMKNNKNNRNKWLHLRLNESEYEQLHKQFSRTTEQKISAYSRKILLGKPMIKGVRNLSTEALIQTFPKLLKDLNGIANNFNQVTHKLHALRSIPEFQHWISAYETDKRRLLNDVQVIRDQINKAADLWLQS